MSGEYTPVQIKTKPQSQEDVSGDAVESSTCKNVCKLCVLLESKYTCPRCNIPYCSLTCYKSEKHAPCSEAFYKECVLDELKDTATSKEDRQKVLEMLANDMAEKEEEEDLEFLEEDATECLSERLQGLDLDKDVREVWCRLTPKEKEDFARMLQDGRLARIIEIWRPWWTVVANKKLVLDHSNNSQDSDTLPDICSDIPDITGLLKTSKPSSNCRFNVLNILVAYAFISRLHNGGHCECPVDSTQDLMAVCLVLRDSHNCSSVGEALQIAIDEINIKSKDSDGQFVISLLQDAKTLILGPGKENSITFMSAALSDVLRLLRVTYSVMKKELRHQVKSGENVQETKAMKSVVFKAEKKVVFLLSWLQRYGMAVHQLQPLLQFEIETRESSMAEVKELKTVVEENMEVIKPTDLSPSKLSKKIVELN